MPRLLAACLFTSWLSVAAAAPAASRDIVIAHIHSRSGPLADFGLQTATGFQLGLDYATDGTGTVNGRRLVVIEKDDEGKPDVGRSRLAAAYADDKADLAVGPTSSGVALALLPLAEQYKKVLIVEPAAADTITGEHWNPYVFRTGRNLSQDAAANAVALDAPGVAIATLAQDSAYGHDGVQAFKAALKTAHLVHEEFLPAAAPDYAAAAQRLVERLKDHAGRKLVWVSWAGPGNPYQVADLGLTAHGIEIAAAGNILAAMTAFKQLPGLEGATSYYFGLPKNPANEWLVANHYRRFRSPPDVFTAGGFAAAMAVVTALKKTGGDASGARLVAAMEGLTFETPKGPMTFRKEDHQALQSMYQFRITADPAFDWGVPELVREIRPDEIPVPIRNKR